MNDNQRQTQTTTDLEALLGPLDRQLLLKLLDALVAEQAAPATDSQPPQIGNGHSR